jgi:hypothetical protein
MILFCVSMLESSNIQNRAHVAFSSGSQKFRQQSSYRKFKDLLRNSINRIILLKAFLLCILKMHLWNMSVSIQLEGEITDMCVCYCTLLPPLWSSGQSSWLLTQRSWVRFPALPDFLSSSGWERGPLSPCEDKRGAT